MQRENTGFYTKTDKHQKKNNIFGYSRHYVSGVSEAIKVKCPCLYIGKHNKKGDRDKYCTNIRHEKIDKTGLSMKGIFVFKNNKEERNYRHELPYNHKYQGIVCSYHKDHGQKKKVEMKTKKPHIPFINVQLCVSKRINRSYETDNGYSKNKNCRERIN
ncbi:MAG: hypothetical protein HBSAPP01_00290 [Candidatus Brocadia sapporoensis]|nr:MAG: hypothetical protein HBSAPP01_00290 [Candidatus Brocadia sapporoensis]